MVDSYASARMEDDGTIIMVLHMWANGVFADGEASYGKEHPQYQEILAHVGGLTPGQMKTVPPWPAKE